MKVLTIIGARPQFIKASVVSRALKRSSIKEVVLHTGQHFDQNMSEIFFEQLSIPRPAVQLDIHGGNHGEMTGRMLIEIEKAVLEHKPDRILVYGDTNSTLAGALVAAKLHIPLAHIEAGLRSFNRKMPEEINRIITDQLSDILFCPTEAAVKNLKEEGFDNRSVKIVNVGDVMQDSALLFAEHSFLPKQVEGLQDFILLTLHRAENTDDLSRLSSIVESINELHSSLAPVVFPLHPRTRAVLNQAGLKLNCKVIDPVGYLEMIGLMKNCSVVLTDSGGVQKEAFFFGKRCVTLRDQTEWVELVEAGVNKLVGADKSSILEITKSFFKLAVPSDTQLYGGGEASLRIVEILEGKLPQKTK